MSAHLRAIAHHRSPTLRKNHICIAKYNDPEVAKLVRLRKQENINHYLRTNGYDIDDKSNELYLGIYDVKNNSFIDTTSVKLIHDLLTISILKGHYMGNKGYQLDAIPTID